jgi:hypothetical protein
LLPFSSSMVGRQASDRLLDAVELADTVERLLRDRRSDGGVHVKELTPHMRPTAGLGDVATDEQLVEPGIAIGVDHAGETLEVCPWVLALAIW